MVGCYLPLRFDAFLFCRLLLLGGLDWFTRLLVWILWLGLVYGVLCCDLLLSCVILLVVSRLVLYSFFIGCGDCAGCGFVVVVSLGLVVVGFGCVLVVVC